MALREAVKEAVEAVRSDCSGAEPRPRMFEKVLGLLRGQSEREDALGEFPDVYHTELPPRPPCAGASYALLSVAFTGMLVLGKARRGALSVWENKKCSSSRSSSVIKSRYWKHLAPEGTYRRTVFSLRDSSDFGIVVYFFVAGVQQQQSPLESPVPVVSETSPTPAEAQSPDIATPTARPVASMCARKMPLKEAVKEAVEAVRSDCSGAEPRPRMFEKVLGLLRGQSEREDALGEFPDVYHTELPPRPPCAGASYALLSVAFTGMLVLGKARRGALSVWENALFDDDGTF
eukprot:m51a1_g5818 hypothetical protein (290) ;mRNA; f:217145-223197